MIRFVEVFPDAQIVSALRRRLSWSHFKLLALGSDLNAQTPLHTLRE
jgi:hypothetical protein